jgi:antitoxin component YwqK of YwqJK toxin-antitoxin module
MKFTVDNGLGLLTIGMSDIGSYFAFKRPLSLVWHDCAGSVGKYCALLPYSKQQQDEFRNKIIENLEDDFTGREEELYELLSPLFQLFKNGEYHLNFYNNDDKRYFGYQTSLDNYKKMHYRNPEILFPKVSDKSKSDLTKKAHNNFLENLDSNRYASNILDWTSDGFYPFSSTEYLIATQPESEINQKRVNYYIDRISKGLRPFILLMSSYYNRDHEQEADFISGYFILDGHHKMLAYQRLKLVPPICSIYFEPPTKEEIEFDAEQLAQDLYPWQMEHILENWDERDTYISEKLKNPDSILHQYIKNGWTKELHPNQMQKHEAFYVNGRIEGAFSNWYDNGQLEKTGEYKSGFSAGTWKEYYRDGQLKTIMEYRAPNRIAKTENYDKNGQIESLYLYKEVFRLDEFKQWSDGSLISHKKRNEQTGTMEELVKIASSVPYKQFDDTQPPSKSRSISLPIIFLLISLLVMTLLILRLG